DSAAMSFLQILNPYANLLSAFITFLLLGLTAVYVVLTWRNLKVFERTSLHEHRLRHLEDIKRLVAVPIREWFEQVLRALEGESRVLTVTSVSVPMSSVITSKAANSYHFKTGQREWPSRTENVLPCRLLWWQVGFSAPAPRAALEHRPVVQ